MNSPSTRCFFVIVSLLMSSMFCSLQAEANARQKISHEPIFIIFDMDTHVFQYKQGNVGPTTVPAGFSVHQNDKLYFRVIHIDKDRSAVKATVELIAPKPVNVPDKFKDLLSTLPSGVTPSDQTQNFEAEGIDPSENAHANYLQEALSGAIATAGAGASKDEVQKSASRALADYISSDPDGKSLVTKGILQDPKDVLSSNAGKLPLAYGTHAIIEISKVKEGRHQGNRRIVRGIQRRYMDGADQWRRIMGWTLYELSAGPVDATDDVALIVFTVEEGANASDPNPTKYNLNLPKVDTRNIGFAFSANVIASALKDGSYTLRPVNGAPDKVEVAQSGTSDNVNFTTGVLIHALFSNVTDYLRPAFSFGITAESTPKYVVGGSLIFGHDQHLVLTGGIIAGKVNRPKPGFELGTQFDKATAPAAVDTAPINRTGLFFGLGFKF